MREQQARRIDASGSRRAQPARAKHGAWFRRRAVSVVAIACLSPLGAAWAVDVTDVRVGQHPGFTRVVFELDEAAGYQLSRLHNPSDGPSLLVELDARTQPAQFSFNYGQVKSLDVKHQEGRLMALVKLRKKNLRLREMTLVDPFRVVIDVMAPVAPTPKKAAPVASKPKPAKSAAVAAKPVARHAEVPTPKAVVPETAKPVKSPATPAKSVAKLPAPKATPTEPAPSPAPGNVVPAPAADQAVGRRAEAKAAAESAPKARKTPEIPRARKPQVTPAAAGAQAEEDDSLAWLPLVGGVLVVILGATAFAVNRRRARAEFGESDFDALAPEPEQSPFHILAAGAEADSPASTADSRSLAEPEAEQETVELDPPVDTTPETYPVLQGVPVEAPEEAGIEPAQVALTEDLARVLKEVESRLSALEGQLSEFAEWKASVEKRITAQTEELRVQRAAIARTQRAVRQLSRPQEISPEASPEAPEAVPDENPGAA